MLLREKLNNYGTSALSNAELLALAIGGDSDKAVRVAEEVINYYGGVRNLGRIDSVELALMDGIGTAKACAIAGMIELSKRMKTDAENWRGQTVRDCADVVDILADSLMYEKREHVVALLLNVKGEIESKEIISIGELSATNIHPREVLAPAIRKGAAGIIIAHNHPSGDATPSNEDILATRRLAEACKVVGIKLVDHVVIGNGNYTSLRCEGIISND